MVIVGFFFNLAGMLAAQGRGEGPGFAIGLVPGALLVIVAVTQRRTPFGIGFITGAMVVALAGGICGAAVGSGRQ